MNWEQVEGNWTQLRGHVQKKWGELTDDDLDVIKGDRKILVGKLEERYGKRREALEEQVDEWFDSLKE